MYAMAVSQHRAQNYRFQVYKLPKSTADYLAKAVRTCTLSMPSDRTLSAPSSKAAMQAVEVGM